MSKEYLTTDFSIFIVTGKYHNSTKKFRLVYSNFFQANSINLWNGRVWGVLKDTGKKVLLKTVTN